MQAQLGSMEQPDGSANHLVFFDVETNVPGHLCRSYELLEFGAVVLDARGLGEVRSFHTLIRPKDLSCIDRRTTDCNTITSATVADAPTFADVADDIYRLLHGHIWAGHNIMKFDILRINEAFSKIGLLPPQPSGVVDTYPLLRKTFGKRAGNYKLATLAKYCGYGEQEHRSIADVHMNIDVLRSCATMLFLESNYPDIFAAQTEVTTSTSLSEQSASFSTPYPPNGFIGHINQEQEVDSQLRSTERAFSSATKLSFQSRSCIPFRMDTDIERMNFSQNPDVSSAFKDLKLDALNSGKEEDGSASGRQVFSSCLNVDEEDEECMTSKLPEVASVLKVDYIPEDTLIGYESVASAVKFMDAQSEKSENLMHLLNANEGPLQSESVFEQGLSQALNSLSLEKDSGGVDAASTVIKLRVDSSTSKAQLDKSASKTEFEEAPFVLASHVALSSIELRTLGSRKTVYYNGFPLHLLEFKVQVRFTVNASYAFDDKGRPRFSILIEPSEAACNVISKCEDLVKSMTALDSGIEWLPALKEEFGNRATRMSIGINCMDSLANYTTEFFRATSNGLEKISIGPVDVSTFRKILPHGSIIDIGYGFYVFNIHNRTGLRLLAKHITFS